MRNKSLSRECHVSKHRRELFLHVQREHRRHLRWYVDKSLKTTRVKNLTACQQDVLATGL